MHTYLQDRGRIVIPAQIRKRLNIYKGDLIYFTETKSGIILTSSTHYNFARRQEEKDITVFESEVSLIEQRSNDETKIEFYYQELADIIQYES